MRTFQSEARRLTRDCTPGVPTVNRISGALWWVPFIRKRRRRATCAACISPPFPTPFLALAGC